MKKILLYLVILLIGCSCINNNTSTMKREYIGHALLIPKHIPIPIYSSYGGDTIGYAINDTIKESYVLVSISEIKNGLANVIIDYPLENNREQYGWVETKYLGTNLSIYDDDVVPIRNLPNEKSKIVFLINNPHWGDLYQIIDAHNKWLKIRNIYNPKETGWVAPEYQCNNPYTSCN